MLTNRNSLYNKNNYKSYFVSKNHIYNIYNIYNINDKEVRVKVGFRGGSRQLQVLQLQQSKFKKKKIKTRLFPCFFSRIVVQSAGGFLPSQQVCLLVN